jgi:chloramphenicol 3-O phosphotransferase
MPISETYESDPRTSASSGMGLIIFLNGTSSSGKSSIAVELLRILDETYFHMSIDTFHDMRSDRDIAAEELQAELDRTASGFHRSVAGMAVAGNNVIVDHVLTEPWRLMDCLALFTPEDVVFVGVRCPLDELQRREAHRGDRDSGLAARQFDQVHQNTTYDIECDTSLRTPLECAESIKAFLSHRPRPTAFEQLRSGVRSGT